MPFAKGQSGNPGGRATEAKFADALRKAIAQDDGKKLRAAAQTLLNLAAKGRAWAVKELADRLDGKSHQSITTDLNVHRDRRDFSDDELHSIAGSGRIAAKEICAPESDSVH